MKKTLIALIALVLTFCPVWLFAQTSQPASVPSDLTADQALVEILKSLGGIKGASGLAIAAVAIQVIMLLLRSPLGKFAGKFKLLIVLGLSLAGGVLALLLSGVSVPAALLHSTTLGAFQVLAHQTWLQFTEPKAKAST